MAGARRSARCRAPGQELSGSPTDSPRLGGGPTANNGLWVRENCVTAYATPTHRPIVASLDNHRAPFPRCTPIRASEIPGHLENAVGTHDSLHAQRGRPRSEVTRVYELVASIAEEPDCLFEQLLFSRTQSPVVGLE